MYGNNSLHYFLRDVRALPNMIAWKRFSQGGGFGSVIRHSRAVADHLVHYGCPAGKVVLIPFGCDAVERGG